MLRLAIRDTVGLFWRGPISDGDGGPTFSFVLRGQTNPITCSSVFCCTLDTFQAGRVQLRLRLARRFIVSRARICQGLGCARHLTPNQACVWIPMITQARRWKRALIEIRAPLTGLKASSRISMYVCRGCARF